MCASLFTLHSLFLVLQNEVNTANTVDFKQTLAKLLALATETSGLHLAWSLFFVISLRAIVMLLFKPLLPSGRKKGGSQGERGLARYYNLITHQPRTRLF